MEWRYMCAEREKEQVTITKTRLFATERLCTMQGNLAFKKGEYEKAIVHYNDAYRIEPELPHYQLNLAAAYLKLNKYVTHCVRSRCRF